MAFQTAGHVIFPYAEQKIANQTYSVISATKKLMLMAEAPLGTEEFLDDGTATDISSKELSTTNYTGGFGGSGRKTVTGSFSIAADVSDAASLKTNWLHSTAYTWTNLGTSGDSVVGVLLIIEDTSDAASHPVLWLPFAESASLDGGSETWTPTTPLLSVLHSLSGDS